MALQHAEDVAPLNRELGQIDGQLIDQAVAKVESDPELVARRAEVAEQIRTLAAKLEAAIEHEDRLLASLGNERRAAGLESSRSTLVSELVNLASPPLVLAVRVANSRLSAVSNRLEAMRDQFSGRMDAFGRAIVADAEAEVARAKYLVESAWQAAIDE